MTKRKPWSPLLCHYPFSEKINKCSIQAEVLFTRLIAQSDDGGNYHGDPKLIAYKLFAERLSTGTMSVRKVKQARDELVAATLLTLYRVRSKLYLHIVDAFKVLRSDVKRDFRFPDLSEAEKSQEVPDDVADAARNRSEPEPLGTGEGEGLGAGEGTSTADFSFEKVWEKYPSKAGKDLAEKRFKATVKAEKEWKEIQAALGNYLKSERVGKGFVQNGSTWFGQWRDWIEPTPAMMGSGNKQSGRGQREERGKL